MLDKFDCPDYGSVNKLLVAFQDLYGSEHLGDQYPDYYAGAFIDQQSGHLVVLTHEAVQSEIDYLQSVCDNADVRVESAQYSYNYLLSIQAEIEAELQFAVNARTPSNITCVGIRDDQNKVFIGVADDSPQMLESLSEEIVTSLSIEPQTAEPLTKSDCKPFELYAASSASELKTYSPGDYIYGLTDGSVGFYGSIVYEGTTRYGFFTAEHVMKGQNYAYTGKPPIDKVGKVLDAVNNAETDVAFVEMTGYGHSFSNTVENLPITADSFNIPPVGTAIYKRGDATDITSGTVLEVSASGYLENRTVYFSNSLKTTMNCTNGDSGGLVYTKGNGAARVVGLVRGGAKLANDCIVAKGAFFPSHWNAWPKNPYLGLQKENLGMSHTKKRIVLLGLVLVGFVTLVYLLLYSDVYLTLNRKVYSPETTKVDGLWWNFTPEIIHILGFFWENNRMASG